MSKLLIPACLATIRNVHAYDLAGSIRKKQLHRHGRAFLASLAAELGLVTGTYDIRSNKGGIAVSGEVTLHADRLYVQLYESCIHPGVMVLYRTCEGRKDYSGGLNHTWQMADLANRPQDRERFIAQCRAMVSGNYSLYSLV